MYSVNSKGNLYKYDLVNGNESLICDLNITSGVLVDNGGKLYFAAGEIFYGMDSKGNILWKSNLKSKIVGNQ